MKLPTALRDPGGLSPYMKSAEARLRRGKSLNVAGLLEFIVEDDEALLAPSVLLMLLALRGALSDLTRGDAEKRKAAVSVRRLLTKLLMAYTRPGPSRETKRLVLNAKIQIARTKALLDFLGTDEKLTVALARHAAEVGVVTPKPGANPWTSRAAQRAEQRARKKAGEPPRPRGRPPRPR